MSGAWRGALVLAFALAPLRRLAAQDDPRLSAAVRLAQEGRSDSARTVVARILAGLGPSDSLYPQVLYTVGLLAATEPDRRLALRRVVLDYSQSAWADRALLQLAQLDYASGDADATVRQVQQLLRDYPGSSVTATAAFWGARAAGDRHQAETACRIADRGLDAVGDDVELRNQLEFQKQRCQGLAAMAAESTRRAVQDSLARVRADSVAHARADSVARAQRARATVRAGSRAPGYYVQVSAVATQAAAAAEIARVKRAGHDAQAVKEGAYLKIRVGPFRSRDAANTALAELKARLGGRPFVVRLP